MIGIAVIALEIIIIIYGPFIALFAIIIYAYHVVDISDFDFDIINIVNLL